jgi:hypothetical protein
MTSFTEQHNGHLGSSKCKELHDQQRDRFVWVQYNFPVVKFMISSSSVWRVGVGVHVNILFVISLLS